MISNANLIDIGSIHQANRCFSDISRGRQCAFMSLSALLHCTCKHVSSFAMDVPHSWSDIVRRCHVSKRLGAPNNSQSQRHCRWCIYPIKYVGVRWQLIQPNQIICPLRQQILINCPLRDKQMTITYYGN